MNGTPAPARRIVAIVNAGSGQGSAEALADRVQAAFRDAASPAEVRLAQGGAQLEAELERAVARRPDVIVADGGDRTVSTVAAALVDKDIALGVLPLATASASNGGSAGASGPRSRGRRWSALRRFPFLSVRLSVDGREERWRTPFVFVGNNEYLMEGFAIGAREGMQDGVLSLYVAQRAGRPRLLQLALRALLGRLRQARDFTATGATEIAVESRYRRLRVAVDGAVTVMTPPLLYRIRRASLQVLRAESPSANA